MLFFEKKKREVKLRGNWKITRACLELICESSKSTFPYEFGGFLRVDAVRRDTVVEVVLLPGTVSGESHAIFKLHMMPIDFSVVGTVHSHPSFRAVPSEADVQLFGKFGRVHIIMARPYSLDSWNAFDHEGNELVVEVV